MAFPCFVCDKVFNRAQDRNSHIRLKRDDIHRQHLQHQQQNVISQFSATVEAVTSAATTSPSRPFIIPNVTVECNDVDKDDLPSSTAMDIDTSESGVESDGDHSIVETMDQEDQTTMNDSHGPGAIDFDAFAETFDFLPDPDFNAAEDNMDIEPSHDNPHHARRTLIDIDAELPTVKWHPTAGQVYGKEPIVHARWQSLFDSGTEIRAYQPFQSRLDWEVAQWAIKEKISQKSFNRLLNIPQVVHLAFIMMVYLIMISGKRTIGPVLFKCPIYALHE